MQTRGVRSPVGRARRSPPSPYFYHSGVISGLVITIPECPPDWDEDDVRAAVVSGQKAVAERAGLGRAAAAAARPLVVFDEIHKYGRWKTFLKGFFDVWGKKCRIRATGSARMDVYKRGGDSLMGRYFPYRMHPFSVAELLDVSLPGDRLVRPPRMLPPGDWAALLEFGGFPEPLSRRRRRSSPSCSATGAANRSSTARSPAR